MLITCKMNNADIQPNFVIMHMYLIYTNMQNKQFDMQPNLNRMSIQVTFLYILVLMPASKSILTCKNMLILENNWPRAYQYIYLSCRG